MIPFEIEYIRPTTIEEAVASFVEKSDAGGSPRYLSGGTELVTMARDGKLKYDTLIDLKRIPETTRFDSATLDFGACLPLSALTDQLNNDGPEGLLREAARGVADRTTRNSITLGGNICGMLPYRETLLPFLILDGAAVIAGPEGRREAPVPELFDKRMRLGKGEFVVSLKLGSVGSEVATFYRRRTRDPRVDYPLVSLCAARISGRLRFAVSGVTGAPVRDSSAEDELNDKVESGSDAPAAARAAAQVFDNSYRTDLRGSAEYRKALLVESLTEGIVALGGGR